MYTYVDIEGDLERLVAMLQTTIRALPVGSDGEFLKRFQLRKHLEILGLDGLLAFGFSSTKDKKNFHNRSYLAFRAPPRGLLRSHKAHPFEVIAMSPKDADISFEYDLPLKKWLDVIEDLIRSVDDTVAAKLEEELSGTVPNTSIPWARIIAKLETRLFGVIRINSNKQLRVEGETLKIPHTEFVIGMDGFAFVLDEIQKQTRISVQTEGSLQVLKFPLPLPGDFSVYELAVVADTGTDRLYLTSSKQFLRQCLDANGAVKKAPMFQQATRAIPMRGNSFVYVSPRVQAEVAKIARHVIDSTPSLQTFGPLVEGYLSLFLPDAGVPIAGMSVLQNSGIYSVSNMSSSHKMTLLGMSLPAVYALAAVGLYINHVDNAEDVQTTAFESKAPDPSLTE